MKNKFFKLKKISWKLTLVYAAMFSLVLVVLSAGVIYGIRYFLIQQAISQVESSSSVTRNSIITELKEHHETDESVMKSSELLSEAVSNSQIYVKIADANGRVVSSSDNLVNGFDLTSNVGVVRRVEINEMHLVMENSKVLINGKVTAYVQVIMNMAREYSFLKIALITFGIADIIGILISVLVGYYVSRRMLKPLDKLTTAAQEISITDLNKKIEVKNNDDELARLARTFNEMIERLRSSFEKQNRFVSDASHELRTPIAVIQGYTELIDRWGKYDTIVLDESISAIKNETKDMAALVERLLFLARSDCGKLNVNKESFDLHDLVEEIVSENAMVFPDQAIRADVPKNTVLFADRKLIKQALRALLDNSIKYSPNHDEIRVYTAENHRTLTIHVKDKGIGIPKEMQNEIFERFYRVDSARERKTGGSGLGLAIVEMIVSVHGGKISVDSEVGKGTLISIMLPKKES